ncbi:integrase arm-type DNA-binding domain-containing protein [Paraburkholderia sp. GAS42]|uniref:integrase arm-type DNA-binding domain-containing protein n=1 Tax=Paraburkholderia sp. GAS42 TaxID=3035135 RepID=UPI003D250CF7
MSTGLLTQALVDTAGPGEHYDGDDTRLELVVSVDRKRRQYRVRSGVGVSRSAERVGAVSMYSLEQARTRAARILAQLAAGDANPEALERKRAQTSANIGGFFDSWARSRQG